jgi:hypothetical protein
MFCSYLMDNFNGDVHAHMLPRLGTNHSHLIPVEDYARLERAVDDALRRRSGQTKPVSLKVGCSPAIGRRSTCRPPKRCCWHCVGFSRRLPIPSSDGAASSTPLPAPPDERSTRHAQWPLGWFPGSQR